MTIRVAMLAAECEPWAKTGGLADVVDALARALGRLPEAGTELDAPVDVFLPRYRSVPVPPAAVTRARPVDPGPGPRAAAARRSTSRSWTWPPTATGSAWSTSPPRSTATRSTTTPTTRGGSRSSAAPRSPPCAGTAGPSTSSTSTTGTPAPRSSSAPAADAAGDPFLARHGGRGHAPQPRLPRLDRARGSIGQLGPARGRAAGGRQPRRHRPPADRDRALGDRQHRVARLRPRGAHARVRHGPRRRAARQGQPVHRHPQRHRPRRVGPGQRPRARRAVLARRPGGQGGLPRATC